MLWNAEWDTTLVQIRVGGELDQATIYHEEPYVHLALNPDGKLNQGRLITPSLSPKLLGFRQFVG